jgi:branched-chain amino acid transport system substrate-binding protein
VSLLPKEIGGERVTYNVLDDASDTTRAVQNTRKLTADNGIDALIGSSTTPNTLAMLDAVGESKTPTITLASSARLVLPMDDKRRWMFKTPHSDSHMASAIATHAAAHGVKTLAFIGFSNALGDAFWDEVSKAAEKSGIKVVGNERYAPTDTSVTGQILKLVSANPDAVVVGASGTPAALPATALAQRGYKGKVYFNHGVSNADFVRVCGSACENAYVPTGPVMVAAALPENHPVKRQATDFVKAYEGKYGAGTVSIFAAYTADAGLLLQQAIPEALKVAKPGTAEFRDALRTALEGIKNLPTTTGVVTMSPEDHVGLSAEAPVMAQIRGGKWTLAN